MPVDVEALRRSVGGFWDEAILPALCEYIRIPCLSGDFDPQWAAHGHMEAARRLALDWLRAHPVTPWRIHDRTLPGRSPLILIEIPGDTDQTLLLYGHLDKQPEMQGWEAGLGPWEPVIRDRRLYGRGGADDGYALFAAVAAVRALKAQGLPHARLVILIEFSEESGSPDLPAYLQAHGDIIGAPELVVALDSGAGDYERLWSTTSLRGMLSCTLGVRVLREAAHSGMASGIVPSSMRILRRLLERLEDPATGELRPAGLHAPIPEPRRRQAEAAARILGDGILDAFNTVPGLEPVSQDPVELLLNNTWRPTLCVVGQEGMPDLEVAGNVLRAYTKLKLSLRLPPGVDWEEARELLREVLTRDPPYRARIELDFDQGGNGWDAPALAPWLERATGEASRHYYGRDAAYFGLGGSIPFMAMLGERFPAAQFLITGVLGPRSNAHGPNEFLHIPYAKALTASVAYIIARHRELTTG